MSNKLFGFEAFFILLPVSVISLWAGVGMIVMLVAGKLEPGTVLEASLYIMIIALCLLGLAALWLEMINRIFFARTLLANRLVSVPMHIGAVILILSLVSLISIFLMPEPNDIAASIGILAFGSPALLPYFHLVSTR
jgi:hypothetical protein